MLQKSLTTTIRTDEKQVIEDVITEVKEKIAVDTPEVILTIYSGRSGGKNRFITAPAGDAARKLFTITKYGKGLELVIRLVTSGNLKI